METRVMTFPEFCQKTAAHLGLELVPMKEGAKGAHTYMASRKNPEPKIQAVFDNMSTGGAVSYLCEIYDTSNKHYLGAVGMEAIDSAMFEHYESSVSPTKKYDEHNNPEGESQLWRFYYGRSLKRACDSFIKGGTRTNPERKPVKVW